MSTTDRSDTPSPPTRRTHGAAVDDRLVGIGLACLLLAHRSLVAGGSNGAPATSISNQALFEPSMASPVLALAVFALLVLNRRATIAEAYRVGSGSAWGLVVSALGVGMLLWSRQIEAHHLVMVSLILQLAGAAWTLGGRPLLRAMLPPLFVLLLAVPLPPQVMHRIVFSMQLATVSLASFLLDGIGQAHEVRGDQIVHAGTVFQVIEGCSGFKSTLSVLLASIVYADFTLRDPRGRWALIALALPIGILMNGVRVTILVLGKISPDSSEHFVYGILAIVVGVVLLAATEILVSKSGLPNRWRRASSSPSERIDAPRTDPASHSRLHRAGAIMGVLPLLLSAVVPIASWPPVRAAINIETLPERIGIRTALGLRVDDAFLGTVRFQHRIYRSYESEDPGVEPIRVLIGHEDIERADRSADSPKTAIPGSGWLSMKHLEPVASLGNAHLPADWDRWTIEYPDRRTLVQQWRVGYAPWGRESFYRWLGLDRAGLLGRRRSPLVIRVEMDDHDGNQDRSWMILRQFSESIEEWYVRSGARAESAQ